MREQLLLLIKISKSEYNKLLYNDYVLYMNPQMAFNKSGLTEGQCDEYEGAITNVPGKLFCSTDEKKSWRFLGNTSLIKKDNNAYIYCMYGLKYDKRYYDMEHNKYYYIIPWKCIEGLWQGDDTEMMIVHNTKVFIEKFKEAANRENLLHDNGKVYYDLEEKLTDVQYCNLAMKDCFESVFHKVKKGYEIQNEVRFSTICPDRPESFKLQLEKDSKLIFTLIPLKYGKDIGIELSELVFDKELNLPVKFSGDIKFYESE